MDSEPNGIETGGSTESIGQLSESEQRSYQERQNFLAAVLANIKKYADSTKVALVLSVATMLFNSGCKKLGIPNSYEQSYPKTAVVRSETRVEHALPGNRITLRKAALELNRSGYHTYTIDDAHAGSTFTYEVEQEKTSASLLALTAVQDLTTSLDRQGYDLTVTHDTVYSTSASDTTREVFDDMRRWQHVPLDGLDYSIKWPESTITGRHPLGTKQQGSVTAKIEGVFTEAHRLALAKELADVLAQESVSGDQGLLLPDLPGGQMDNQPGKFLSISGAEIARAMRLMDERIQKETGGSPSVTIEKRKVQ